MVLLRGRELEQSLPMISDMKKPSLITAKGESQGYRREVWRRSIAGWLGVVRTDIT